MTISHSITVAVMAVSLVGCAPSNRVKLASQEVRTVGDGIIAFTESVGHPPDRLEALRSTNGIVWVLPANNFIDPWGMPYRYSKGKRTLEVRSSGKDKKFETKDDIAMTLQSKTVRP